MFTEFRSIFGYEEGMQKAMRKGFFRIPLVAGIVGLLIFSRCTDKFDLSTLPSGASVKTVFGDTTYVQLSPEWGGFNQPEDIAVGYEPLIYVADTRNDRIVMLDISGQLLGYSKTITRPIAVAEDRRLDLLACGLFSRRSGDSTLTYSAIFRIRLFEASHDIANARIDTVYFEPTKPVVLNADGSVKSGRLLTGVSALATNDYYVTRTGVNNFSPIDPDNAVLTFDKNDRFITRVPNLQATGTGLLTLDGLSSIRTFNNRTRDFIITETNPQSLFKVQWVTLVVSGEFSSFQSQFSDLSVDILQPGKFRRPEGVAVDNVGNIYVIDAATDSLYRFSNRGVQLQAFGGRGSGENQFNNPHGVAFFDKVVYVADTGNNRILRFKLTTDF
jgi:hypothetical protein